MAIAALVTWLLTAAGGFVLLGTWIAKGGVRQPSSSHFPPPVIFGHFLLAAVGLVLWIIYVVVDTKAIAWVAFALLVPVALLGFFMLMRWLPVYRARAAGTAESEPAERHFPVMIVGGHGVFAVVTVVLVLLTALGVGS
ncbi:hypothetical protein ACWDUL_25125 [Nocardia niigatensis]|uniref:hypothetical protein n=1 Tax=Nocardia niigatensis TaxID=209249 RepID=UPI0002F08D81|nr:hypothetical protein [Nocardia niigatensis]